MDDQTKNQLQSYRKEINTAFTDFFATYESPHSSEWGQQAWEYLVDFSTRPGKRIRGALALHAYLMFGGTNRTIGIKAALAVELTQNYLLIVDDVMDRSMMRRGSPTIHELYKKSLPDSVDRDERQHMSNMLAINVGLIASHIAHELLAQCGNERPSAALEAATYFNRNIATTAYGQVDDLYSPIIEQTRELILATHRQKSSFYTFVNPLQLGAVLASDTTAFAMIEKFGLAAGLAYQIQDDCIGLFGNPNITGKSDLDDLKEGKVTLFIQQALQHGDTAQQAQIREVLGKESITDDEAERVREIVRTLGVKDAVIHEAYGFAMEAKEVLSSDAWPQQGREFLEGLMEYIVRRLR